MIAVIFEVYPEPNHKQDYFDIAASLSSDLHEIDGFISIERFQSLADPEKILSLSFWRDDRLSMNGEISRDIVRPNRAGGQRFLKITGLE